VPNLGLAADALYSAYIGDDFVEHENYPLDEMLRTRDGGAIILCTSDEADPSNAPVTGKQFWHYPLPRLTQHWRVVAHHIEGDLGARVNARRASTGHRTTRCLAELR
jgi:hypothetical protein